MSEYEMYIFRFEQQLLKGALIQAGGNICQAARETGLHRNTISRKIERFGVDVEDCKRIAAEQRSPSHPPEQVK